MRELLSRFAVLALIISSSSASIWAVVTALGFHIVLTKDRFLETAGGHTAPYLGKRQQRTQDLKEYTTLLCTVSSLSKRIIHDVHKQLKELSEFLD